MNSSNEPFLSNDDYLDHLDDLRAFETQDLLRMETHELAKLRAEYAPLLTPTTNSQPPNNLMSNLTNTLATRATTHGNFTDNSRIAQQIKQSLRHGPSYQNTDSAQRESLDMIAHKLARIVSGDPHEPDHWLDISGYATLVHQELTNDKIFP